MSRREVVVTGIGVISSLGLDTPRHFAAMAAGLSGWREDPDRRDLGPRIAPVVGLKPRQVVRNRMLRKILRPAGLFAVGAAGEALADAGLHQPTTAHDLARAGIYLGSVSYDLPSTIYVPALRTSLLADETFCFRRFAEQGMSQLDPLLIVKGLPNAPLCGISIEHGLKGPNANFANGPVSGLEAVITAARAVARGDVDLALAGGADSLLLPEHAIAAHLRDGLQAAAPAPGSGGRDLPNPALPLGEGAAICVLESAASAEHRGAKIYARIGASSEGYGPALRPENVELRSSPSWHAGRGADHRGLSPRRAIGQGLADGSPDPWETSALATHCLPADCFVPLAPALGATGAASGAFALVHGAWALFHRPVDHRPTGHENHTPGNSDHEVAPVLIWAHDTWAHETCREVGEERGTRGARPQGDNPTGKSVEIVLEPWDRAFEEQTDGT